MSLKVMILKYDIHETTLLVSGSINSENANEFQEELDKYSFDNLVLDFRDVEYISSSGLRVLLNTKKKLGSNGKMKIIDVNETVYEIFSLTGFDQIFDIEVVDINSFEIKAIFFDIDGTLLSHKTDVVPDSTKEALHKLKENGIKIVVSTGRNIDEYNMLPLDFIDFDAYLTLNGNICLDHNKEMFAGLPIDRGEVEILTSIFKASKIPFVLIGEKGRYINFINDVVIETQNKTHGSIPEVGEYSGEDIYQCLAFTDNEMKKKLEKMLDKCKITSWHDTGIDIISNTGGKASGIKLFIENEGLKRSQTMAFGDSQNDIEMLKFVGIGVAMGNATTELKEEADYITSDIDDDGIKNALEHFKLI